MKQKIKNSVITKIRLDWGHNVQYAVFLNNSLKYDGNKYDHGSEDFEKTVTQLVLNSKNKPLIFEVNDISEIKENHKKSLLKSNSDWSDSFSG